MKLRNSYILSRDVDEMKRLLKEGKLKKDERKVISSYSYTRGHEIEELIAKRNLILGKRGVELSLKNILIECDGYDLKTKTLTEVKSNFGSKKIAMSRTWQKLFLAFHLQELQGCRKIKKFIGIAVNSKITKKYGMDFSVVELSIEDVRKQKFPKIYGVDLVGEFKNGLRDAESLLEKVREVFDDVV